MEISPIYLKSGSFQQRNLIVKIEFSESWNEFRKSDHVSNDLVETVLELLPTGVATVVGRHVTVQYRVFCLQQPIHQSIDRKFVRRVLPGMDGGV